MEPTQTPTPESRLHRFKKLALPLAIIAVIVLVILIFVRGSTSSQGASLFRGVNKTNSLKVINNAVQYPGSNAVPCLVGDTTPRIKVISPNGGETFAAGQQITVKWATCNIPATHRVRVDLNISGNIMTALTQTLNDGSEVVTLPTTATWSQMVYGNNFKVTVWDVDSGAVSAPSDQSDNLFSINGSPVLISLVGTPTLSLVSTVDAGPDVWQARFKFNVTSTGNDVFLPKDNFNYGTLGIAGMEYVVTGGAKILFAAFEASDSNIEEQYSYMIGAGETEEFTFSVYLEANNMSNKVTLNSIWYELTDSVPNGTPEFLTSLPNFKTSTVYLAE